MESHDDPVSTKKEGGKQIKKLKVENAKSDPSEIGCMQNVDTLLSQVCW